MTLLLAGTAIMVAGGLAALAASRAPRVATAFGVGGCVAGGLAGLAAAVRTLIAGTPESLRLSWNMPGGSFFVEMDPLSAFFILPTLALSALAAIYGGGYLQAYREKKSLGPPWFFFNLLVASMVLVVVARNGLLFLLAWETMALASFFLVMFEHEKPEVRDAGWTYLVATHLGTAFLFAFFLLMGRRAGSLDFDRFGGFDPAAAGLLFLLAVVGFGTKAGFMPFHVWLPEAHPAAPSHVSAVMSGVMIKTGIYGLLRALTFLGAPPAWWGGLLLALGLVSAVFGILFAHAQHDLKRMLAYSSVENIGIIAIGLGIGLLGRTLDLRMMTALGFAGALLHVVNHGAYKSLLFLGAGAVLHATGTRRMDRLGGLLKRMPSTGFCFFVAAAAVSALPPFNGFVGEFLIALGALNGQMSAGIRASAPSLAAIAGLALVGGLTAACFTKAFGIVFLGEPRADEARSAHESGAAMKIPLFTLAAACLALGILSPFLTLTLAPTLEGLAGFPCDALLEKASLPLRSITILGGAFLALLALLAAIRRSLLAGRTVGETVTWDGGYARPTARMQYTSSSFAQPLTDLFGRVLRTKRRASPPRGYFPGKAAFASETPDLAREAAYRPAFLGVGWILSQLRWLQSGHLHLYVLYIALTLLALLMWRLG